jgi:GntR family phosphonate transport system transcriptional regulator
VSLWRQIGEAIGRDIESGKLAANERLPNGAELGKRFQVNRHTISKAIAYLQSEGLVRIERGRGAYVLVNPVEFRLGPRHWFEQNLLKGGHAPSRTVLGVEEMPAPPEIASALGIRAKSQVALVTILGEADGLPVNLGYHYFPLTRLKGVAEGFRAFADAPTPHLSFSAILKQVGVNDWRRKSVRIRGRLPTRDEALRLKIAPNDPLLVTTVLSVDDKDSPVVFAHTCYGSSRTELVMDL